MPSCLPMYMFSGAYKHPSLLLRPVAMPDGVAGRLLLTPMPGRDGSWDMFLAEAREAGVHHIACLTPWHEVVSLSPDYAQAIQQGVLPFDWAQLPMRNFGLGAEDGSFKAGVDGLADQIQRGRTVVLHCAAGIGRTGKVAACVLKRLGLSSAEALQRVRDAGSNPESAAQGGLIDAF